MKSLARLSLLLVLQILFSCSSMPLYGNRWVRENPYTGILYALKCENMPTYIVGTFAYQGGKKCSFFGKFGVLCFIVTPVLRFALLPYYRQLVPSVGKDSFKAIINKRVIFGRLFYLSFAVNYNQ